MQVILLERVEKLGTIGDEVTVKPGFARNFLLPEGKALRANDANRRRFEAERESIEKLNEERANAARGDAGKIDDKQVVMIRQAGETGQLYGSVSGRDIAEALREETGVKVERAMVRIDKAIKAVGLHELEVRLHPEVAVTVSVNIARSEDEAERQAAGEDVIATAQETARAEAEEQSSQFGGAMDEDDGVMVRGEDSGENAEDQADDAAAEEEEAAG